MSVAFDPTPTDHDPAPDRPAPHNTAAENALIASCLTSTKALTHALTTLTPDDFYTPANRRIFAAMQRLHHNGQPVDHITVADETDTTDPANVVSYLTGLGHTAHHPRYAHIIRRHAHTRRLIHAATDLIDAAYTHDDTALEQAQWQLLRVIAEHTEGSA